MIYWKKRWGKTSALERRKGRPDPRRTEVLAGTPRTRGGIASALRSASYQFAGSQAQGVPLTDSLVFRVDAGDVGRARIAGGARRAGAAV